MSSPPAPPATLAAMGRERFVSLSTFRRSGEPVPTPVWVAAVGDDLVVTTPAGSGKTERLRNDPRVQLRPCGRLGAVAPDAPVVEAVAHVVGPDGEHPAAVAALRRKYGLEYRAITGVEAISALLRRRRAERVILRISAAPEPAPGA